MANQHAIDYARVFKTRRDYCQKLLEVSSEQDALIAEGKYTELLDLLGRKQRILGRMQELRDREPELWTTWRVDREHLDNSARTRCDNLLDEAEQLLARLMEQEKQSTAAISEHRDATHRELVALQGGSKAHEAYHDSTSPATHHRLDIGH